MKTIDALKRLERAGAENSRTTKKLREAAAALAHHITTLVPDGAMLPRKYEVVRKQSNVGSATFLYHAEGVAIDSGGEYLHGDFHCWIEGPTREIILDFAQDVATGWLEEVAVWLEQRNREEEDASEILITSKP